MAQGSGTREAHGSLRNFKKSDVKAYVAEIQSRGCLILLDEATALGKRTDPHGDQAHTAAVLG